MRASPQLTSFDPTMFARCSGSAAFVLSGLLVHWWSTPSPDRRPTPEGAAGVHVAGEEGDLAPGPSGLPIQQQVQEARALVGDRRRAPAVAEVRAM